MKKVLLGLSGGVDSTVAAHILKEQGYTVVGATLDLLPCDNGETIAAAKKAARQLGIEHYVLDFKNAFKENVINPFVSQYLSGETPNPCVECNKFIKFGVMADFAESIGADYIATGHYAKIEKEGSRYLLKKADFIEKDQSYMLYTLSQQQLSKVVLPLQALSKEQVRAVATELGFDAAQKKDSQEICFIKDDDYVRFLTENAHALPPEGDFVDTDGNVLGTHGGFYKYTIGQRKGLGIALGKPMFVVDIDSCSNRVVLGEAGEEYFTSLIAERVNFIPFDTLDKPLDVECKVRYGNKFYNATVIPESRDTVRVEFKEKARAVTPGQSVVFYDGDLVVGGGVVVKGYRD